MSDPIENAVKILQEKIVGMLSGDTIDQREFLEVLHDSLSVISSTMRRA